MSYTSETDRTFEIKANMTLSATEKETATTHTDSLPQVLTPENPGLKALLAILDTILQKHSSKMLTLVHTERTTDAAVALTSVLFDLHSYPSARPVVSTRAKKLFNLATLWNFRTCWYVQPQGYGRAERCDELLNQHLDSKTKNLIKTEIINKGAQSLTKHNYYVAHQWGYAASALLTMSGRQPFSWKGRRSR